MMKPEFEVMKLELQYFLDGMSGTVGACGLKLLIQRQCHAGNGAPEHKGAHGVLQRCHEGKG
jgi:hypothetical protein